MPVSNYLVAKWLDHTFNGTNYVAPETVYIALMTAAPNTGGGGTEVAGNNYGRVGKACDTTNFPATGTDREMTNGTNVLFPTPSGSWGTIVAVAVYDAAEGGNLLLYGVFADPRPIATNDKVEYAAGQLKFKGVASA